MVNNRSLVPYVQQSYEPNSLHQLFLYCTLSTDIYGISSSLQQCTGINCGDNDDAEEGVLSSSGISKTAPVCSWEASFTACICWLALSAISIGAGNVTASVRLDASLDKSEHASIRWRKSQVYQSMFRQLRSTQLNSFLRQQSWFTPLNVCLLALCRFHCLAGAFLFTCAWSSVQIYVESTDLFKNWNGQQYDR